MMRLLALVSAFLWAFFLPIMAVAANQHATFVELAPPPKWQLDNTQQLGVDAVHQWGGDPAVDREYGVSSVQLRTYRNGDQTVQAVVEEATDPSAAYGLLTFYQNETMPPERGMKLTVIAPDQAYLARGQSFIRVLRTNQPRISDEDFHSLLVAIAGTASATSESELLPAPLPEKGRVPGSLKYVLGPIAAQQALPFFHMDLVGFQQGAELEAAAYSAGGRQEHLLLISYPTPQIANLRFQAMTHLLGVNAGHGATAPYGKRRGTYVLFVQNASSQEQANKLMDRLSFSQIVSWDQPYPKNKPITVQLFELIVGNLLLVLILAGMAIGTGVLIFVFRRIAAKWFPDSDWAQGFENSIIQLKLK